MSQVSVTVAVTGHRLNQLPEDQRPRIARDIAKCLERIEGAARSGFGPDAALTLRSALAEGADRYAAEAALKRGWRLISPLPFSVARYEEDFPDDASKAAFRALMAKADRVIPVTPAEVKAAGDGGAAPYAAVGRKLIKDADVLICVWNGKPPAGPGGTAEVAAMMLEQGGGVVWTPIDAGAKVALVAPERPPRQGSRRRTLLDAIAAKIPAIPRPADMRMA